MAKKTIIKDIVSKKKLDFKKYCIQLSCGHNFIFDESVTPFSEAFENVKSIPCKQCFFNKKEL